MKGKGKRKKRRVRREIEHGHGTYDILSFHNFLLLFFRYLNF